MLFKFINGLLTPKVDVSRRHFLIGAGSSLIVAPAIVKISSIMPVKNMMEELMPSETLDVRWYTQVDPFSHTLKAKFGPPPGIDWLAAHEHLEKHLEEMYLNGTPSHGNRFYQIPLQKFGINESLVPQKRVSVSQDQLVGSSPAVQSHVPGRRGQDAGIADIETCRDWMKRVEEMRNDGNIFAARGHSDDRAARSVREGASLRSDDRPWWGLEEVEGDAS